MPLGLCFLDRFCVVDDRDQPVPVLPKIEDHVAVYIVGIFEPAPDIGEVAPPDGLDNADPCSDLIRRIRVPAYCLAEMPAGDDMHFSIILHNL